MDDFVNTHSTMIVLDIQILKSDLFEAYEVSFCTDIKPYRLCSLTIYHHLLLTQQHYGQSVSPSDRCALFFILLKAE